eukprot:COSAG05_NODE_8207_length_726_cov_1.186603_1_plen_81_part_10
MGVHRRLTHTLAALSGGGGTCGRSPQPDARVATSKMSKFSPTVVGRNTIKAWKPWPALEKDEGDGHWVSTVGGRCGVLNVN